MSDTMKQKLLTFERECQTLAHFRNMETSMMEMIQNLHKAGTLSQRRARLCMDHCETLFLHLTKGVVDTGSTPK